MPHKREPGNYTPNPMDLLRRFLTLSLRENQIELQLSEMRRNQVYMMQHDHMRSMNRALLLA